MVSLYWIRHKDHTDIASQGYVGVSKMPKLRWNHHFSKPTNKHIKNAINKYGWENLIKEIILVGDINYCLDMERKLRPTDFIGWNATLGGGMPPKPKKGMGLGRKISQVTKDKISKARKGKKFSMESIEKIRQAAFRQWSRQKSITPLPADEISE